MNGSFEIENLGEVGDLKNPVRPSRNVLDEILGSQKDDRIKIIDAYEESSGKKRKSAVPANWKQKSYLFNLNNQQDKENFDLLLNSPKHEIVYYKDSFTKDGTYTSFAIYRENMDYKEPKKEDV